MKWIDVNVTLPQVDKEVLVIDNDNQIWIMILRGDNGNWECPNEGWGMNVTHWMELPKPPKRK